MNWRDIFASRHTLFLEKEIEDIKARHQVELARALTENLRLLGELDRIRVSRGEPGTLEPKEEANQIDPDAPPYFSGTPFQKIQQREMWMESAAGKNWMAKLMNQSKIGETEKAKEN